MGRVLGLAGLLLISSLAVADAAVQVQVDGDRLTLRAENAPLQDILQAIAEAGRFSLRLDAPLAIPISVQFEQQSLLEALESLLREQSMLIRHAREQGALRVEEVHVLASSYPVGRRETITRGEPAAPGTSPAPAGLPAVEPAAPPDAPPAAAQEALATLMFPPDATPAERIEVAFALAGSDEAETGRAMLVELLRNGQAPAVREQALGALAALETVPLEPLTSAALTDPESSVRSLALGLLGERARADPQARATLERAAMQDQDPHLRETAQAFLDVARDSNP